MYLSALTEALQLNATVVEIIGYFASALVFVSLMMTSIKKLRWISLIGSGIFAVYAVFIESYHTAIMNLGIVALNAYYLFKLSRHEEIFTVLPSKIDSKYLHRFVMYYGHDIQKYFPDFELNSTEADVAFFVYRDMTTASLIMGKELPDGGLMVELDYATPQYRDMRIGKYLYGKLAEMGYKALSLRADSALHEEYMKKMGFAQENGLYVKRLP